MFSISKKEVTIGIKSFVTFCKDHTINLDINVKLMTHSKLVDRVLKILDAEHMKSEIMSSDVTIKHRTGLSGNLVVYLLSLIYTVISRNDEFDNDKILDILCDFSGYSIITLLNRSKKIDTILR